MRPTGILALTLSLTILTGCHSPYVNTTVSNRTPTTVALIEVDYPSASFGVQTLAPSADFHYRFKVLGDGPLKITYTDISHVIHTATGPDLKEGAQGLLQIIIAPDGVHWIKLGSPPAKP
jgi:hypothetical protein